MSTFGSYAHYYDLLYADKDYGDEAQFVDKCIRVYAPDARSVVELGCGTGGHAFGLAKRGWTIHGADLNGDMLDRARKRLTNSGAEYASKLRCLKVARNALIQPKSL